MVSKALARWVVLAGFMHFVCVSLEDVRIVNVVFDWVCNGAMSAFAIHFEIGFPVPLNPLYFCLLFDLLAQLKMVSSFTFRLSLFISHLSFPVFSYRLNFEIMHLILLHLLIFLQLKLLQEDILHDLALLLPSLLILVLRPEERLPTIIPFFNQMLKFPFSLLIIIHKGTLALSSDRGGLNGVSIDVLEGKSGMQGRNRSVSIEAGIAFPLSWRVLRMIVSIFLLLLKLHSLLEFIIINGFECVPVVLAGVVINLDLLNDLRIDFLSQLLAMMLLICVIHPVDFLHAVFYFRRML